MKAQSNSKSGHKNISYNDEKRSYVVSIRRNGRRFIAHANTKDEASISEIKHLNSLKSIAVFQRNLI